MAAPSQRCIRHIEAVLLRNFVSAHDPLLIDTYFELSISKPRANERETIYTSCISRQTANPGWPSLNIDSDNASFIIKVFTVPADTDIGTRGARLIMTVAIDMWKLIPLAQDLASLDSMPINLLLLQLPSGVFAAEASVQASAALQRAASTYGRGAGLRLGGEDRVEVEGEQLALHAVEGVELRRRLRLVKRECAELRSAAAPLLAAREERRRKGQQVDEARERVARLRAQLAGMDADIEVEEELQKEIRHPSAGAGGGAAPARAGGSKATAGKGAGSDAVHISSIAASGGFGAHVGAVRHALVQLDAWRGCAEQRGDELLSRSQQLQHVQWLLQARQLKLVSQLLAIYPIHASKSTSAFTIRGIRLANSAAELGSRDEEQVSTALGYAAHLTSLLSKYLMVPLRYPLVHASSRSYVKDDFGADHPLYRRGVEQKRFEQGLRLLRQDVEQLLCARGVELRSNTHILANLRRLIACELYGV